ncbi:Planctomycete cytochrome C [Calycomorphotria hydatis]|uniref:Planctomycete cytochrome C n=2 Tax=Calycomorphotria hydatis TaxID=2528027 RepID=A0A517TEK1_9PLAN|nr:Planctomycete cytochrome C [Calycomorphotria hydatis]
MQEFIDQSWRRNFVALAMLRFTVAAAVCVACLSGYSEETSATPAELEFFEQKVRPLLANHCYSCHSAEAKKLQAGLYVDSLQGMLQGGDSGEAIVPGDPDGSLLMEAVRFESYEMPPKGKLADDEIAVLEKWIKIGAPWPKEETPVAKRDEPKFDLQARKQAHWVWQPLNTPQRPAVKNTSWPTSDVDYYILSKLEEKSLQPSGESDRLVLLRRLYMDLIGLPPTVEQTTSFINDQSANAIEHVVDGLLDSPHFGERWGRHWLDLVRYAESRGHEFDNDIPNAFQYRDYVIRALNADVPYDQFVREHIAGDLITEPRLHPTQKFNESVLGTGFWFLGEWVHSPVDTRKDEADRFDNMLDVMSKTFLGVTVACARCHDHKFDAISTADYYSLSGFLQSSDYRQMRFESYERNRHIAQQLAELDQQYQRRISDYLQSHGVQRPEQTSVFADDAVVIDYGNLPQEEYMQDGFIFGDKPQQPGLAYLHHDKDGVEIATQGAAVNDQFWNGLKSISEDRTRNRNQLAKLDRSGRRLSTPTFEVKHGDVACLVQGSGHIFACVDSHRLVHGPLHGQTVVEVKEADHWKVLNLHRYVGHRIHLEFIPATDAELSVRMVVQGLSKDELSAVDTRLQELDRPFAEYAQSAEAILHEPPAREMIDAWKNQREQLCSQVMLESHIAPTMMDGSGEDDHILIRGNSSKPGKVEPRHFLTAVSGDAPLTVEQGSGRLELAELINDPANPLTNRVIVNRIWHHLMGRGIVPTVDDFGVLGQRPTHPGLLDHLANRFLADGRSIKQVIKYIVLSKTYQMSSQADPVALVTDPENLLWHYRPPKRLEGEVIRDSLLAISGELDPQLYGPPVPIHLTAFMDGRGRPGKSGPLNGDGRRSIYISIRRNFLSPFMLAFDTPVPFSAMGRRNSSNVPAQALILMNDPFVVQQAQAWGEQVMNESGTNEGRIQKMYFAAFVRHPSEAELDAALQFVGDQPADADWSDLAHTLINTKEFFFLR